MNVLLNAYNAYRSTDPYTIQAREFLRRVEAGRRFTSELVKWELLHPNVAREEIAARERWLTQNFIKVRDRHPAGYLKTLLALVGMPQARGGPVDGALAAYSIASKNDPNGEWSRSWSKAERQQARSASRHRHDRTRRVPREASDSAAPSFLG
jgi:hypothetical protein